MTANHDLAPGLYLVGTPIGNLEDMTLRAIRVLKQADLIACEDTRQTQKLLNHYGIETRAVSYHEHNEASRAEELVEKLAQGARIAVVSNAGMPGISDPGFRLVSLAIERGDVKGEITLLIGKAAEGASAPRGISVRERVEEIMREEKVDEKAALKKVAKERGISKSQAYRELQKGK